MRWMVTRFGWPFATADRTEHAITSILNVSMKVDVLDYSSTSDKENLSICLIGNTGECLDHRFATAIIPALNHKSTGDPILLQLPRPTHSDTTRASPKFATSLKSTQHLSKWWPQPSTTSRSTLQPPCTLQTPTTSKASRHTS